MAKLINTATATGTFGAFDVNEVTTLTVELSALEVTKTADKMLWLDDDPLTYTITLKNVDPADPGEPVTGISLLDTIDTSIVELDTTSVLVNNTAQQLGTDFLYDDVTGELTFITLQSISPGGTTTISFQVDKII